MQGRLTEFRSLDLAIVQSIVSERHGGELACRNLEPGAEFRLRLPLAPAAENEMAGEHSSGMLRDRPSQS